MSESRKISNFPGSWEVDEYELTGHSKLYAVFSHQDLQKEVHIVPYKTYEISGLTNSHRITAETPENGLEVVAEGLEVEQVDEAKKVARMTMNSI